MDDGLPEGVRGIVVDLVQTADVGSIFVVPSKSERRPLKSRIL